jgi:ssDNA-binding Zn-finger/Zn-ribbon topoisomerase 1
MENIIKEARRKVQPIMVNGICPACGEGLLVIDPTGQQMLTNPPQIPHKCEKCGAPFHVVGKSYPFLEWDILDTFAPESAGGSDT